MQPISASPPGRIGSDTIRFAVIGDYGDGSNDETAVANQIKSWDPDFIITVGDNNYPSGAASTIDKNIGRDYHEFIYPYKGGYGEGAATNRFFPSLGNRDLDTLDGAAYFDYFTLPGNERYYDFVWGPVHFFVLNSDPREPDGNTSSSAQGIWLQNGLAASTSCWNLVYFHHAPYSSDVVYGSTPEMQWPFQAWGAHAVLSGHAHVYERIVRYGFPYFVNGLGGNSKYEFGEPVAGSQVRYNAKYGAQRVTVSSTTITYEFITYDGLVVETYSQNHPCVSTPTPTPTRTPTPTPTNPPSPGLPFIFTAAGDYGENRDASAVLNGIASSGASFNLALGDLVEGQFSTESAWCDYVKSNRCKINLQEP
jgi:hypothetical protein